MQAVAGGEVSSNVRRPKLCFANSISMYLVSSEGESSCCCCDGPFLLACQMAITNGSSSFLSTPKRCNSSQSELPNA